MRPTTEPGQHEDTDPIPLSALQHAVYCPRQAALIHLERLWAENRFTAEGAVLHAVADEPGLRRSRGVRRVTALPIACRRLGIAGVADIVDFRRAGVRDVPYPVEIKRGRPKLHRADEVQLCAQALCLEEMFDIPVREGALFYAEPRRRTTVTFDDDLRRLTEEVIAEIAAAFSTGATPPPTTLTSRCRSCSLEDLCRPELAGRSALLWRRRAVAGVIASEGEPDP
jgi:CRISPR-associated exonuclease Cas4